MVKDLIRHLLKVFHQIPPQARRQLSAPDGICVKFRVCQRLLMAYV